jgi:hypothetical protein
MSELEKFLQENEQIFYRHSIRISVNIPVGLYRHTWTREETTHESKWPGRDIDKFHPEPRLRISETVPLHTI